MEAAVNLLVAASREVYEGLLREPDFMEFYSQATPIDALEQSSIGSRPSRRTGQRTLADLRAIPWVFSWNQARFYLPGWYGVGSALAVCARTTAPAFGELKASLDGGWPFLRYVFMNVETNLASADREIMSQYAGLVADERVRAAFLTRIMDEFERTHAMLTECFGRSTMDRGPRAAKTLRCAPTRCACCTISRSACWTVGAACRRRATTGRQADAAGAAAFHQRHRQRPADDGVTQRARRLTITSRRSRPGPGTGFLAGWCLAGRGLPFVGLDEALLLQSFQPAAEADLGRGVHPVDVQDAAEMIDLVLDRAGEHPAASNSSSRRRAAARGL